MDTQIDSHRTLDEIIYERRNAWRHVVGVETIMQLRLLIARAADKDSLDWWDCEAFSPHSHFILRRIFPMSPALAARQLALEAAACRHGGMLPDREAANLFRLVSNNADKALLRSAPVMDFPVPLSPIQTMEELRGQLLAILGEPMPYKVILRRSERLMEISIPPPVNSNEEWLHWTKTLAWAFTESRPGMATIPYFWEPHAPLKVI